MTEQTETEQAVKLEWTEAVEGNWTAESVLRHAGLAFFWHIASDGNGYNIKSTDEALLDHHGDDPLGLDFPTLHAAQAECERIEAIVRASPDPEADQAKPEQADTPTISNEQAAQLFVARGQVKGALAAEDDANAQYKYLKKRREACEESLGELIDSIAAGPGPLFDKDDEETTDTPDPERWRGLSVTDLVLPNVTVQRLAEHRPPILTLGDLSDWMAKKGEFWAVDIAGIGAASKESAEEGFRQFWEQHPEYCQPTAEQEEANAEPGDRVRAQHQPCGCVLCICEDEERCHGRGAKPCGKPDDQCSLKNGETVYATAPGPQDDDATEAAE